MTTLKTKVNIL